jgi:chemotaxis protein CheX
MESKFTDPILKATLEVLSTMTNLQATHAPPSVKSDVKARGDVTGIMSLAENGTKISIAITFTRHVVFDIMQRMLGTEMNEIDDMAMDMAGEFANMVAGVTKRHLEVLGLKLSMSLPTVVSGNDHVVAHKSKGTKIIIPFSVDSGKFSVEFCYEE